MPSSELSDALNPNVVHTRAPPSAAAPLYPSPQSGLQPSQQYISDLQLAISEPPPPVATTIAFPEPSEHRKNVHAILRSVLASREVQENERKRRLEWEREQEETQARRQAETERQIRDMREEMAELKALLGIHPPVQPDHAVILSPVRLAPSAAVSKQELHPPSATQISRMNHHDTRCLTVQHAMRTHILLLMSLTKDSTLPPSHLEGTLLESHEPIRFVWGKTTKQSTHNARMKTRILDDIKVKRYDLYPLVPLKDWNTRTLDAVFEQAFSSLRQRFKVQSEIDAEERNHVGPPPATGKKIETLKSVRVRRLSRKRTKLNSRADARNRLDGFEHVAFDGAFQLDCLSSEESDEELHPSSVGAQSSKRLVVHPLPWRSARLVAFYASLDAHHLARTEALRKTRGLSRKPRVVGEARPQSRMPPRGVRQWMISKRWWRDVGVAVEGLNAVVDKGDESGMQEIDWLSLNLDIESESDGDGAGTDEADLPVHNGGLHAPLLPNGTHHIGREHEIYGSEQHFRAHYGSGSTSCLHNALANEY